MVYSNILGSSSAVSLVKKCRLGRLCKVAESSFLINFQTATLYTDVQIRRRQSVLNDDQLVYEVAVWDVCVKLPNLVFKFISKRQNFTNKTVCGI